MYVCLHTCFLGLVEVSAAMILLILLVGCVKMTGDLVNGPGIEKLFMGNCSSAHSYFPRSHFVCFMPLIPVKWGHHTYFMVPRQ